MIPNNIELPDDVIKELTSNPVLLRWLASIQSQLITSTVEVNGVGCTRLMRNVSGVDIQELEVVDGSVLKVALFSPTGNIAPSAVVIEGKWQNTTGAIMSPNTYKFMTRIS